MAQSRQISRSAQVMHGRGWVWLADAIGLGLAATAAMACAGAPVMAHVAGWLIMALPLAGFAAVTVADHHQAPQPSPVKVTATRTIMITPRPDAGRYPG